MLTEARLQLHWAAQIAAGVGRTLIAPRSDDSHTSFNWSRELGALLQEFVDGTSAGLRLRDLTLLLAEGDTVIDELPLRGRTLDDGFAFLEQRYGRRLNRPDVDLPDHDVSRGGRFDANEDDLRSLAGYYDEAATICEEVRASDSDAGPVRCWPHHFDIATLIDRGDSRTLGIGMSPGDRWYDEPYYYLTPWPYPSNKVFGELHAGHWHTTGWVGAVLTVGRPDRRALVRSFIAEAREHLMH